MTAAELMEAELKRRGGELAFKWILIGEHWMESCGLTLPFLLLYST